MRYSSKLLIVFPIDDSSRQHLFQVAQYLQFIGVISGSCVYFPSIDVVSFGLSGRLLKSPRCGLIILFANRNFQIYLSRINFIVE